MEGSPRTRDVNSRVRKFLEGEGALGAGFRCIRHRLVDNRFFRTSRLHEKLYYFSHPVPSVLVGTFNPSGNLPEDPDIIRKIGDQDRGHNVLVDIQDVALVEGLYVHARRIFEAIHGPWEAYLPENNRALSSGKTQIIFFPRSKRDDFDDLFNSLEADSSLRIAVSHLNDRGVCKRLSELSRLGTHIEVLAHDTQRRVPSWVEKQMLRDGIIFSRYDHPDGLPMHNKFMLIDTPERKMVTFGSMNLSVRSLHANHELLVFCDNSDFYEMFQRRWREMLSETRAWSR